MRAGFDTGDVLDSGVSGATLAQASGETPPLTTEILVIFLLAGLIPLGIAMERTGGADWLASVVVTYSGGLTPVLVLGLLYSAVASRSPPRSHSVPLGFDLFCVLLGDQFEHLFACLGGGVCRVAEDAVVGHCREPVAEEAGSRHWALVTRFVLVGPDEVLRGGQHQGRLRGAGVADWLVVV
jgi:hypothetical protein